MSKIFSKIKNIINNPKILLAYCNYILIRIFLPLGPILECEKSAKISGWSKFSEYWTFHKGIIKAEIILMKKTLQNASYDLKNIALANIVAVPGQENFVLRSLKILIRLFQICFFF